MTSIDTVHVDLTYSAPHTEKGNLIVWSIFSFVFLCWSGVLSVQLFRRRRKFLPPRLPYLVLLLAVLLNFAACISAMAANVIQYTGDWFVQPISLIAANTTFELAQFWGQTALFVAVCLVFFALTDPLGRPGRWGSGVAYTSSKFVFAFYAFAMFVLATAAGGVMGDSVRKIRNVALNQSFIFDSDTDSVLKEYKAAMNMTLYAFPALFVGSALFVLWYAVSYFRAHRRSSEFGPAPETKPFITKTFVALTAGTYLLFAVAVLVIIILYRTITSDDMTKVMLASAIVYNWLFSCIVMLLVFLALKWTPDTKADAVLNTVPMVPRPPPSSGTAAVEIPRGERELEREREEDLVYAHSTTRA